MRSKVHFSNHRQLRCLCIKRSTVSKVLNLGPLGQDIQCHHRCQTSTVIEVKWKPGLLKSIVINLTLLLVYFKVFLIPLLSSLFRKMLISHRKLRKKVPNISNRARAEKVPPYHNFQHFSKTSPPLSSSSSSSPSSSLESVDNIRSQTR